jgi:hypothetical protein
LIFSYSKMSFNVDRIGLSSSMIKIEAILNN